METKEDDDYDEPYKPYSRPSSETEDFVVYVTRPRKDDPKRTERSIIIYRDSTFERALSDGFLKKKAIIFMVLYTPAVIISGTILRKQYKNIRKCNPIYQFGDHKIPFNDIKKKVIVTNKIMFDEDLHLEPRIDLWNYVPGLSWEWEKTSS
jgi:hypothetical protein